MALGIKYLCFNEALTNFLTFQQIFTYTESAVSIYNTGIWTSACHKPELE